MELVDWHFGPDMECMEPSKMDGLRSCPDMHFLMMKFIMAHYSRTTIAS